MQLSYVLAFAMIPFVGVFLDLRRLHSTSSICRNSSAAEIQLRSACRQDRSHASQAPGIASKRRKRGLGGCLRLPSAAFGTQKMPCPTRFFFLICAAVFCISR